MTATRRVVTYILVLIAGVAVGWFLRSTQLNDDYNDLAPKHRPTGVPDSAVWAGGEDGGAYIDCYYNKLSDRDDCTIYNDWTGFSTSGSFTLDGQSSGVKAADLRYLGAAGDRIWLKPNIEKGKALILVRVER